MPPVGVQGRGPLWVPGGHSLLDAESFNIDERDKQAFIHEEINYEFQLNIDFI